MTSEQTDLEELSPDDFDPDKINPDGEIFDMSQWSTEPPGTQPEQEMHPGALTPDHVNDSLARMLEDTRPDVPLIADPPAGTVELLWGIERDGHRYKTAIVRELNGGDEEALARLPAGNVNYNVMVVDLHLRCGVVQIGGIDIAKDRNALGELLIFDRDILFKEILLTTYGKQRTYRDVLCPTCGFAVDLYVDVEALVEIRDNREFSSDRFVAELRDGRQVLMRYVSGNDQLGVFQSTTRPLTTAEANSAFLASCVEKVDGKAVANPQEWSRELGAADRATIVEALLAIPSIGFKEVEVPCEKCGERLPTKITWADLLPS
jgi:hypothetical protein